jgi:hypothetical protein
VSASTSADVKCCPGSDGQQGQVEEGDQNNTDDGQQGQVEEGDQNNTDDGQQSD